MRNRVGGFTGQISRINLTNRAITKEDLDLNFERKRCRIMGGVFMDDKDKKIKAISLQQNLAVIVS